MSEAKVKIIQAAAEVFTRYGVKRTSVGDVAEAAGVSRQTLYTHFKNKDELLAAVISAHTCDKLERLSKAWADRHTLGDILDAYFDLVIFEIFEVLQNMPDFHDLLHGIGDATAAVALRTETEKATAMEHKLSNYQEAFARSDLTPGDVAEFVVRSGKDFLTTAKSREELARLLKTLRASVLALGTMPSV